MTPMRRISPLLIGLLLAILCSTGTAQAEPLSIYTIQYTTEPSGISPCDGQVVDCDGGIVTHIFIGSRPRLILIDPDNLDGWGAIQVKGWDGLNTFDGVGVGDYVSFTSVFVEEYRGTTFLQFDSDNNDYQSVFDVTGTGTVPAPKVVTLDQIAAPVEVATDEWKVVDHSAEPYESMWLTVEDVAVTANELGKGDADNYNLHNGDGDAWASDYMNEDMGPSDKYRYDKLGSEFVSITGILEQYNNGSSWDYYQLLTTCTEDFVLKVPEPTTCASLLGGAVGLIGWTLVRRRRRQRNTIERI